jgi:hypothetical protein
MLAGTIDRGDQCNQSTLTRQIDTREYTRYQTNIGERKERNCVDDRVHTPIQEETLATIRHSPRQLASH